MSQAALGPGESSPLHPQCISGLLEDQAFRRPEAIALTAPGRTALSYARLLQLVQRTVGVLNAIGIGRQDRVAIALPNGPEMAASFLAVAAGATCAPLNPSYRPGEFEFYLSDLRPKLLIAAQAMDSPAVSVAQVLGIPVIELSPHLAEEAGIFTLKPDSSASAPAPKFAAAGDVALVLHTSGTTSRPNLVPLTHANLCHSAHNMCMSLGLTPADRCLNIMPLFHIHGLIGAVLSSMLAGASVACTPGFHAPKFFEWMRGFRPTWYTAVPTMHQAILQRAPQNCEVIAQVPLRFIRSCSSALPPQLMAELERVFGVPVIESYGMTEASHQMASNPLPPGRRKPGSVGMAAGPEIAIMGEHGELKKPGEVGEIVLRGENVTRGYENDPEANQRALTGGWFRTGDQGYLDAEGYLYIRGRTKEIINRGGEKIFPREIDEVLMDHPAVAQAVAFALPDPQLGEDVGAAVVLRQGASVREVELRKFVAQQLADFKVPRRIVFLKEIPKGPTGKPERIGLAAKLELGEATAATKPTATFVAPRTPTEKRLCELWRGVLGVERVGTEDEFLELGGDSILATLLLSRVRQAWDAELSMVTFFENPTVAAMAAWLDSPQRHPASRKEAPVRTSRRGDLPLSLAQQGIWLAVQHASDPVAYIRPAAFRFTGLFDIKALQRALDAVVARHEALRATFHTRNGTPVQVVSPLRPVPLTVVDLSDVPAPERMARALELAVEDAHRPFDLAHDLMLRATLLRLDDHDHILLATTHHIAADGWSTGVFLQDMAAFYRAAVTGEAPDLPELPVQYADYARWQRKRLQGEIREKLVSYWKERLAGIPSALELPTDYRRSAVQTFRGARERVVIPGDLIDKVKAFGQREGATLFMTLLAVFQTLLHRYTGSEDIVVGSPVANRTEIETEPLIGVFINPLVMRTDFSGRPTFRQVLHRVRETALGAFAHQELPFESLVEVLQPERSLRHSPLFQVVFQLRNLPTAATALDGLRLEEVDFDPGIAQFDDTLEVSEKLDGLHCTLDYNRALFEPSTARRMLGHYRTLLESTIRDPEQAVATLPILTEPERRQLLVEWNKTRRPYPQACAHELFAVQAECTPHAVAVSCGDRELTYGELHRRSSQLAHYLARLGVRRETLVGILMERCPEMVVVLLGILKAGGAYVPLDPAYPQERLSLMVQDAGMEVLLTHRQLIDRPPSGVQAISLDTVWEEIARESPNDPASGGRPDDLAYVIYTSGSTGGPKGVAVPHRAINRLVINTDYVELDRSDVVAQVSTVSFDAATFEIWGTLLHGARLAIITKDAVLSPSGFAAEIERQGITTMFLTTALFNHMAREVPGAFRKLRTLLFGGEAVQPRWVEEVLRNGPPQRLLHVYGPTETTTFASWYEVEGVALNAATIPVGRPMANTQVYILDRNLQPVPIGVPGELYIGGDGVARGYLNRPELTAESFVPDPFSHDPGTRLYRTGDLGRFLPDGNIEFLGRLDDQVKIRGFRIQLGEIQATLAQNPAVKTAAVVAPNDTPGQKRLVAYVAFHPGQSASEDELRAFLKSRLPDYMLPSHFMFLEELPMLPTSKVDRRALPAPDNVSLHAAYVAPRDRVEHQIVQIWEELLGVSPIGIRDDFFDLGGHSLLAFSVMSRIEQIYEKKLQISTLFAGATVEHLANTLADFRKQQMLSPLIKIQKGGSRIPLFFLHGEYAGGGFYCLNLARHLGKDQPFYALEPHGLDGRPLPATIEVMAASHLETVRALQPRGPYILGGYCNGGLVAFEMARQLEAQGETTALLIVIEASARNAHLRPYHRLVAWASRLLKLDPEQQVDWSIRLRMFVTSFSELSLLQRMPFVLKKLKKLKSAPKWLTRAFITNNNRESIAEATQAGAFGPGRPEDWNGYVQEKIEQWKRVLSCYVPYPYSGHVTLFRCEDKRGAADPTLGWRNVASEVEWHVIPGGHESCLTDHLDVLAEHMKSYLDRLYKNRSEDKDAQLVARCLGT